MIVSGLAIESMNDLAVHSSKPLLGSQTELIASSISRCSAISLCHFLRAREHTERTVRLNAQPDPRCYPLVPRS